MPEIIKILCLWCLLGIILLNNASSSFAHSNIPLPGVLKHKKHSKLNSSTILSKSSNAKASFAQHDLNSIQPRSTGLECFTCKDLEDCRNTWPKIWKNPNDPSIPFETCSKSSDYCLLHFSTTDVKVPKGKGYEKDDLFLLMRSGCETPKSTSNWDDGNCVSTEYKRSFDSNNKFTGTHGSRTCYCNTNKCNTNYLDCYGMSCDRDRQCYDGRYESSRITAYKAHECTIEADPIKNSPVSAYTQEFRHSKEQPRSGFLSRCELEFNPKNWEDDRGQIIKRECRCSTKACNKIASEFHTFFPKPTVNCFYCHSGEPDEEEYCDRSCKAKKRDEEHKGCNLGTGSCRRGGVCYTRYVKASSGDFTLLGWGCEPPPPAIRNGCTKPEMKDGKLTRTCYCDYKGCNILKHDCQSCTEKKCREPDSLLSGNIFHKERCEDLSYGQPKKKECFITYDESVSPRTEQAGCRDSTFNDAGLDPECDKALTSSWIGSGGKKSCRCDSHYCNTMVINLAKTEKDPEKRKELQESTTYNCFKEESCRKGECETDKGKMQWKSCVGGCRYTRELMDEGEDSFTYSRGCANDKNIEMEIGQVCKKYVEGIQIHGQCVCHNDGCNNPDDDSNFDKQINELSDPDIHKKQKLLNGATSVHGKGPMIFSSLFILFFRA